MIQIWSIIGAVITLFAYLGYTEKWFGAAHFNFLNLIGGTILCLVAYVSGLWGFVLLNVVWSIIALRALMR